MQECAYRHLEVESFIGPLQYVNMHQNSFLFQFEQIVHFRSLQHLK